MYSRVYPVICVSATSVAAALIIYAVVSKSLSPTRGAYLVVLFALFAVIFTLFLDRLLSGGRPAMESNWGGLGGGLSGWRVSMTLTLLLLSIGFLALLVVAIGIEPSAPDFLERYLVARYRAAIILAEQKGIKFDKREIVGGKLLLKGTAPSQTVANEFWDQVKLINPLHDDVAPDLSIKAPTPAGATGATGGAK